MKNLLEKIRNKEVNVFDTFIIIVIAISAVTLGLETDASIAANYAHMFKLFDNALLIIFFVEIMIRIWSYSPDIKSYLKDPWNIFDIVIFGLCILPHFLNTAFAMTDAFYAVRILRLIRALKAFRVLRLIPRFKQMQILITTLFNSLPSMGYVLILLGMLFYLFAIIGHSLFSHYDAVHFGTLASTMLTLFESATGQWVECMDSIVNNANDSFYNIITPSYFILFYFVAGMIILNLFIGIIISEMQKAQEAGKRERIRDRLENDLDKETLTLIDEIADLNTTINDKLNDLYDKLDRK